MRKFTEVGGRGTKTLAGYGLGREASAVPSETSAKFGRLWGQRKILSRCGPRHVLSRAVDRPWPILGAPQSGDRVHDGGGSKARSRGGVGASLV